MVGSPDPPSLQDLAAYMKKRVIIVKRRKRGGEEGYHCEKGGGEPSPVQWSQFLGSISANLIP